MLIFLIFISMFGLSLSSDFPEHEFVKKIQDGKKREMTVTKTFVTLIVEQYKFRKRRFIGKRGAANFRGQFICTGCENMGKFTGAIANIDVGENDDDEQYYSYNLVQYPHPEDHICVPSGVEDKIRRFRREVEQSVRDNPTQPMPASYDKIR